jgi:predicted RNase H-like HicB family nuclease
MRTDFYTCAFTRDPDGGWTAVVLDLPGVVSEGETFAEAQSNISEALELDVEARRARPEAVPTPRPIADLMDDPDLAGELEGATLVQIAGPLPPPKSVPITMTIDDHLLANVDQLAKFLRVSRSSFFADAVRDKMESLTGKLSPYDIRVDSSAGEAIEARPISKRRTTKRRVVA